MIRFLVFALLSIWTTSFFAQENSQLESLDRFILNQAERYHIPGIAACVVKGDQIVWSKGYGWANLEERIPMSVQGIMNIASVSKTITATAIMQLWEKKKIDLDADVNDYLPFKLRNPRFPQKPITIRQLLTHSSSIRDGLAYRKIYNCGDPNKTLKEWIEHYLTEDGEYYDPEENFHPSSPDSIYRYSNVGFGLLGYIVERVSGQAFHRYCRQHIFTPLEMASTGYFLNEIDTSRIITPYLYLGPLQRNLGETGDLPLPHFNPYCIYSFWNYPDGLVRTTVEDLAKFATAYMHGGAYKGKRILQASTIEQMMRSQLSEDLNEDGDQGLSWFHSSGLDPSWFHGGSDPGVTTRLYVDRVNKISVIVFQNANEDNSYYIARELYRAFK